MDAPAIICAIEADAASAARAALEAQIDAWNRGDLEAALAVFWDNEAMRWTNRRGTTTGYADFAAAMREAFADPAQMGRYTGAAIYAEQLTADAALLVADWRIERDGERLMGGISTQLWRRIDCRWRIVYEHAG